MPSWRHPHRPAVGWTEQRDDTQAHPRRGREPWSRRGEISAPALPRPPLTGTACLAARWPLGRFVEAAPPLHQPGRLVLLPHPLGWAVVLRPHSLPRGSHSG